MESTDFHIIGILVFLKIFLSSLGFLRLVVWTHLDFIKTALRELFHCFNFVDIYFLLDVCLKLILGFKYLMLDL